MKKFLRHKNAFTAFWLLLLYARMGPEINTSCDISDLYKNSVLYLFLSENKDEKENIKNRSILFYPGKLEKMDFEK